jgi:glycosyltransferase involved in cell wall biosynthesis
MSSAPAVTVVITVLNGACYVGEAIESILAQSFPDFELLIVDDGSRDATAEVLRRYRDPRLAVITLPENRGIAAARNAGIEAAHGRALAFLDHDDIASPDRLEKQLAFFDSHPAIGLIGGAVEFVDAEGDSLRTGQLPEDDPEIRWLNLLDCPMRQSTLTVRGDLARQHLYDPRYLSLCDWDFIQRMLAQTLATNLPEVLVRYRSHPGNVSHQQRVRAIQTGALLSHRAIRTALPDLEISLEEVKELRAAVLGLIAPNEKSSPEKTRRGLRLYLDLFAAFKKAHQPQISPDVRDRRG